MAAREWFERARKEGFAIGAFNVDSLEIFKAIVAAGKNKQSPIMLEFSHGEVTFFGVKNVVDLVKNVQEEAQIPILLNLDHAPDYQSVKEALEAGFELLHFDGSKYPLEENIQITKKIVEEAHAKGLLVEGEIDKIAAESEVHSQNIDLEKLKKGYSDPATAKKFVEETGVDTYASVFGNVHGTFPVQPPLDFYLLKRIREVLPQTFLSMHGGSGIAADQVRKAIEIGRIVKINVNTEIRKVNRETLVTALQDNPDEYAVYKIMPSVLEAVQKVVEEKIELFGSAGKA